MARPRDFLMEELRAAQKKLVRAKKSGNKDTIAYFRASIAELQKEMESAE
jgi:hypothetical protein